MNIVILTGRLGKEPEVRYTQSGTAVASYSIAVPRISPREGDPDADWFECTAWGKAAEFAEKYMTKGRRFAVTGRLQNDDWTDKDGNKRRTTKVIVQSQEFADAKPEGGSAPKEEAKDEGWMNVPDGIDEDLPFN